eukprot:11929906-Alexandrium_andersonii.AAC.1
MPLCMHAPQHSAVQRSAGQGQDRDQDQAQDQAQAQAQAQDQAQDQGQGRAGQDRTGVPGGARHPTPVAQIRLRA